MAGCKPDEDGYVAGILDLFIQGATKGEAFDPSWPKSLSEPSPPREKVGIAWHFFHHEALREAGAGSPIHDNFGMPENCHWVRIPFSTIPWADKEDPIKRWPSRLRRMAAELCQVEIVTNITQRKEWVVADSTYGTGEISSSPLKIWFKLLVAERSKQAQKIMQVKKT